MARVNQPVTLEARGSIGLIYVDNPPVNALSQAVRAGLIAAVDGFDADATLEAGVVVAVQGACICSPAVHCQRST